jgi:hypothetical protein
MVRVETTLLVVCAVVYGTTPDYGLIATDTDMVGSGHAGHHPLLTGLKPDTLYYARLQGVGPDGTLYRSEEYTFRTSPVTATSSEPNLALVENGAHVVGVSSNFNGGADDSMWGALKAIDGDLSTAWSSDGGAHRRGGLGKPTQSYSTKFIKMHRVPWRRSSVRWSRC